jgi:uncharacterized protein (TIGR02996 family)
VQPVDVTTELERAMLVLDIQEPNSALRTLSFTRHTLGLGRDVPTLSIGHAAEADVRLASPDVADIHFRLFERDGLLHLASLGRVAIDGNQRVRRNREVAVAVGTTIAVADCSVQIRHFLPIGPADFEVVEKDVLEMTTADVCDHGARLVYADVLEERGWLIRAEYLRVQIRLEMSAALPGDREAYGRFQRKLTPARRWLVAVGHPRIADTCGIVAGRACPVQWGAERAKASVCWKCQRAVRYPADPPSA